MSSPNPPQNLQVVGPQETPPQAAPKDPSMYGAMPAPPQAEPQQQQQVQQQPQRDYVDPVPPEDRILSPEETENFFKHGTFEPPSAEVISQAEQVGAFLSQEAQAQERAAQAPPQQMPGQPTPQQVQQLADQTLQQGQPSQAPGTQAPQVAPQVQQVPPQAPPPGAPGVQPQPVQQAAQTPQEAALAAQVQTLMGQVGNLSSQLQQVQTGAIQQAQQPQQQQEPPPNIQIPPQYLAAMDSENPAERAAALNAIVNGVAQSVQQTTLKQVDQRFEQVNPVIQQQISVAQEQANIKSDMYGTYPELSNMMEQVAAVATQLQNQGLTNGQWNADLRDQIAERLSPLVPGLAEKVQQVRSARYGQGVQPQQQFLPQVQPQALPPGVVPQQVLGGTHVPTAPQQQGPMLVRDAYGNISQVHPQQYQRYAGPQARPGMQGQVNPELVDIWNTLGYRY